MNDQEKQQIFNSITGLKIQVGVCIVILSLLVWICLFSLSTISNQIKQVKQACQVSTE